AWPSLAPPRITTPLPIPSRRRSASFFSWPRSASPTLAATTWAGPSSSAFASSDVAIDSTPLRWSDPISFSSRSRDAWSCATASGRREGATRSAAAARATRSRISWISRSAPTPVTASIRRTPAPIDSSLVMRKIPMSPVQWQCVPPQSSRDGPASTTRTTSSYFSPKSATAPHAGDDLRAHHDHARRRGLRVRDHRPALIRCDVAAVADLAATLGIEGCAIEHDLDVVALLRLFDPLAAHDERDDPRLGDQLVIAAELGVEPFALFQR